MNEERTGKCLYNYDKWNISVVICNSPDFENMGYIYFCVKKQHLIKQSFSNPVSGAVVAVIVW